MSLAICRLCSREAPLRVGHIIPKFAVDWIKRTSATGYLRDAINPNLRRQDVAKAELLCEKCEQLFSRDETIFAEAIFYPFLDQRVSHFQYEEWLRRFAVSLAWRGLVTSLALPGFDPGYFHEALDKAAADWGRYLLRQSKRPGDYTHHMFLAGYADKAPRDVPKGFQSYLMRAVDGTVGISNKSVLLYTKLPAILFVSHVVPGEPAGWRRTRILRKGEIGGAQVLSHGAFARFLLDRASEVLRRSAVSTRQTHRMRRDVLKDPERALASKSYEAILADERLRRPRRRLLDADW